MAGLDHAYLPGDNGKMPWVLWSHGATFSRPAARVALLVGTTALMVALFVIDAHLKPPLSVGVLYGFAILIVAALGRIPWVVATAVISVGLTLLAFNVAHRAEPHADWLIRCGYGIALQVVLLLLVLRGMVASRLLVNQAKLLDQTHDSVVLRRLDATLLYWNRGAVELFGWTFEEARQHSQAQLIGTGTTLPPMPIEEFVEHGPWRGEIAVRAKDGRAMIIDCHCSLLVDDRRKPFAVLTTGNDVTERHAAQEHLSRSERRYQNIFQTTGIGIWECDLTGVLKLLPPAIEAGAPDLRPFLREHPEVVREAIDATLCIDVNAVGMRMFGARSSDGLLGSIGWQWPPESEPSFAEAMIAAADGRESCEVEVKLNTLDRGKVDFFLSIAFPPQDASRESVFITVTDITGRVAANASLRTAQAELARSSRLTSLGELAASVAHEVKQPVAGILANGQAGLRWLGKTPPDLTAVEKSLSALVSEAKRAGAIISGIRELALDTVPRLSRFGLGDLFAETLRLVGQELSEKGIEVGTDVACDVEPVLADRVQIQQVLINLILNASQAMADSAARQLTLTASWTDGAAVVAVTDSGRGVAPEVRQKLFTAFNTSRSEGMGLGLSICATIVGRHEGRIWLDETAGALTRFAFTIPRRAEDETVEIAF